MHSWDEAESFLISEAARDLVEGAPARPCLLAFRGEKPLLVAFLRDHAKGAYADPMVEVIAIAGGLAADRLMVSFSGRAWSHRDPIPPVLDGVGDLRQRVVFISRVDGAGHDVTGRDAIWPYAVSDGIVRWGERLEHEPAQGWIPQALRLAVEQRELLSAPDDEVRAQVLRCERLGHLVGLAPGVYEQLGLAAAPVPGAD